jgi:hypothetical protein
MRLRNADPGSGRAETTKGGLNMERLLKVSDISERYGCTANTARKYLQQMFHYENPLTAPLWALTEWEQSRESMPAQRMVTPLHKKTTGRVIVPRKRD